MLTRALHLEEGQWLRVMGLSPGTVATGMQVQIKASGINPVSRLEVTDHIPADWPAQALLWMCSPEADDWRGEEISLRDGGVWTVTLNRPDKANSLTRAMLEELDTLAIRAGAEGARVLVLTGTGKVFSAGADLDEASAGLATADVWERLSGRIAALPCLTIAALNGTLAGGAMGMVLACDLRIGVPGAKFFYPVMKLGFLPQPSDPGRLAALVGPSRAKMILMAGVKASAEEALAWGLLDRIVAPETLMATAAELAEDAGGATPAHVAAIKAMVPLRG
jgi:enoyl-CoA hydratase/carnithine racemase